MPYKIDSEQLRERKAYQQSAARICLSSLGLFLALLPLFSLAQEKQTERPNVLFILADDLGYRDLSCLGSKFYETPNIDRISREGTIFTNGYAASRVCSPSRASILTGQFSARHGITDWIGARSGTAWRKTGRFNKLLPPDYVHALPASAVTLPEALKEAGYKTFFAGKWHLGKQGSWPEDHGFGINIGGWNGGSPAGGYFSPWKNPNLENNKPGENLSMRLAKETVHFLENNHPRETGQPVFAFLSFYAVHGPIQTSQKKWKQYRDKAEELGIEPTGFKMGKFLPIRQTQDNPVYAGLVSAMDDAVGLVLDALDSLGLSENTVIVFTSDNGGVSAGDAYSTSLLPYRGGKGYQFEGGIREPYFIKVPGLTAGIDSVSTPVSGTDFYPTILELTGTKLRPEDHVDGLSLVPLLQGSDIRERPLIWHYPHYGNQGGEPSSMIRLGCWKLIHYYEDGREVLYELNADPYESTDQAHTHPEKVQELHALLFEYLDAVNASFPTKDPEYDPEAERAYLEQIRVKRLPRLEKQRMEYLSEDFNPNNDWWGSSVPEH